VEAIALQFTAGGYRILGNGNTTFGLMSPASAAWFASIRVTAVIEAPLAGATGLTVGWRNLILTGANIYSGGTAIRAEFRSALAEPAAASLATSPTMAASSSIDRTP
jgi:hypothetical protein